MDRSEKGLLDESTPGLKNRYPAGIKKLEGDDQIYRLSVGDYRILCQVKGRALLVLIVRIGNRWEI
jgi:mRNA-degrading endonuclease RelE of RelBE toxin-antitoxin system